MHIFVYILNLESFYEEKFVSEENDNIIANAIGNGDNDDDPSV